MFRMLRLSPPNGWNAVAWELVIVTLGVLIALGAQQLVENWQWRKQVRQANEVFKNELGGAAGDAYERLAVQGCLTSRLKDIAARLNEPDRNWSGMPEQFHGKYGHNVLPVVYRPPHRPAFAEGWNNALANGTINHVSTERAMTLARAYNIARLFGDVQNEERIAQAKLAPLASNRELNPEMRLDFLKVVSDLDRINDTTVARSNQLLDAFKAADLGYTRAELRKYAAERVNRQRRLRGPCVTPPPIDVDSFAR